MQIFYLYGDCLDLAINVWGAQWSPFSEPSADPLKIVRKGQHAIMLI